MGSVQFDIEGDVSVMPREENTDGWWKVFKIFKNRSPGSDSEAIKGKYKVFYLRMI